MTPDLFDVLRRLTDDALDAEDRFSVLITGTDAVPQTFADLRRIFDLLPDYSRRVGRP